MTDCTKCKHKNSDSKCFCPPEYECKAFEKEVHKVKYAFEFNADDDWTPGESVCWTNCPFSVLIDLGKRCKCVEGKVLCPFLQGSYSLHKGQIDFKERDNI